MMKFITSNTEKYAQARAAAERYGFSICQVPMNIPEIQAESSRFVVFEKAKFASKTKVGPFIVEDSSFHVVALGGFPGVYVKYCIACLLCEGFIKLMEGVECRDCYFESHIAYVDKEGFIKQFFFKRTGLFVMNEIYSKMEGWSDLWRIIGIKDRKCHFSQLSSNEKEGYKEVWAAGNAFTDCFEALRVASLL